MVMQQRDAEAAPQTHLLRYSSARQLPVRAALGGQIPAARGILLCVILFYCVILHHGKGLCPHI